MSSQVQTTATTTTKPKKHINRTNRISLGKIGLIYVSSDIVSDPKVKVHLIRLNQILFPRKNELPELIKALKTLMHSKKDHFSTGSVYILSNHA